MDTKLLEKIGLTRNESLVYLTLLRLGISKTGEILKESGLNSGKIYEILESLKVKGLVSESIINNVKHFSSAPPSQILEWLKEKRKELDEEENAIKNALPELEKVKISIIKMSRAVTYIGFKGIKTAADEALDSMKSGEQILAMGVTKLKDDRFNEFWKKWSKKRVKKKIVAKHIFSERSDYSEIFRKMKLTESRVLESLTPVTIDIFGENKVLILNYEEPTTCILIHDKNTAISFREFFNQLWTLAKN